MRRRTWLKVLLGFWSLATLVVLGVPAAATALSPALAPRPRPRWTPLGWLESFTVGAVTKAVVPIPQEPHDRWMGALAVYVWRPDERQVVVFSRTCTDLGCPVEYDPGSACFFCPCHGGIFDQGGQRLAGPPPRPLHRYATRLREGHLEIDLASVPATA